jgi:predicted SnoaL-like aldol condensation-catalyzing enzyme
MSSNMQVEQNKGVVRDALEDVLNARNFDRAEDYFAADYVDHTAIPGLEPGLKGLITFFTMLGNAFPDGRYTLEDLIGDGNRVAQR